MAKNNALESRISSIITNAANEIVSAVRKDFAAELGKLIASITAAHLNARKTRDAAPRGAFVT